MTRFSTRRGRTNCLWQSLLRSIARQPLGRFKRWAPLVQKPVDHRCGSGGVWPRGDTTAATPLPLRKGLTGLCTSSRDFFVGSERRRLTRFSASCGETNCLWQSSLPSIARKPFGRFKWWAGLVRKSGDHRCGSGGVGINRRVRR